MTAFLEKCNERIGFHFCDDNVINTIPDEALSDQKQTYSNLVENPICYIMDDMKNGKDFYRKK